MLSKQIKIQVFKEIIETPNFLGKYEEYDGILTFLNKIWDLKDLPSEDTRFKNAYEDANQHIVNNDDWSIEDLFLERFRLIDGDENHFVLFLEAIVNPIVRNNKDDILLFVSKINNIIHSTGFRLILSDYFEELPVYKFKESADFNDLPVDIIANKIPIYLYTYRGERKYPCFFIKYINWNDNNIFTSFELHYQPSLSYITPIGRVKIMKRETNNTLDYLFGDFTSLSKDFCSLGQGESYYLELKKILGSNYTSFLLALRDVATFPKIHELFENDLIYKTSLIRNNENERLVRTIRYKIEGISPNEYYKFNYRHKLPYAENEIVLNFDFEYNTDFEHRIYAIIGKNGTGKTKILSSLAKSLSEKEPLCFTPKKPVYGKVFTVSYSFFDKFDIPNSDSTFNYIYCGLKKSNNILKTDDDLLQGFYQSVNLIKEKKSENYWYEILNNFIDKDFIDGVFDKEEFAVGHFNYSFIEYKFNDIRRHLSSGQSIILFMISEILSQIRYDSLILFDEPETHLHPNAISALLNALFDLVSKFESFCIIATHSPIIIQEIPARNIFVIERENNSAYIRQLERESFGENLTVITQEIFGNREEPRHFINLIRKLISKGKTYSEILSILESDNLPVTSNIRLYIKALMPIQ